MRRWHKVRYLIPLTNRPVLMRDHFGEITIVHPGYIRRFRKQFAELGFQWKRYTPHHPAPNRWVPDNQTKKGNKQ